jgi:hypothetical protein
MKTIRASEIGSFLYCRRAWWYGRQGYEPENQASLAGGRRLHERHGHTVMLAGCLNILAYGFLLLAVVLAAAYIALQSL